MSLGSDLINEEQRCSLVIIIIEGKEGVLQEILVGPGVASGWSGVTGGDDDDSVASAATAPTF